MSKGWDSTALKKLRALTGKGLSTAEIGKRLGMSKNAIVGKLNRLGWNCKATTGTATRTTTPKAPAIASKKAAAPAKKSARVTTPATAKATKQAKAQPAKVKTAKNTKPVADKVAPAKKAPVVKVAEPAKETRRTDSKTLAMHQRIVQHSLEMANMKPNQCRWPIGDPDSEDFHFCGAPVFVGKPYCYEHCRQAYQFAPPKKK